MSQKKDSDKPNRSQNTGSDGSNTTKNTDFEESDGSDMDRFTIGIPRKVKEDWYVFLKNKYGTVRGPCGIEIANLMRMRMNSEMPAGPTSVNSNRKMNITTLHMARTISDKLRSLRNSFPLFMPLVIRKHVESVIPSKDHRTVEKYFNIIVEHSRKIRGDNSQVYCDVTGFCDYVDNEMLGKNNQK